MKCKSFLLCLVLLILINVFFSYCHFALLNLDTLQVNEAKKVLTKSQINTILSKSYVNEYLNIIYIFFSALFKVLLVTFIIKIGCFLFSLKLHFKSIITKVIFAEYVFLLPILFEIIYFKCINNTSNLNDIQYFYPLSALSIFGYKDIEPWLIYPLQTLNLFEVAYIIYLAYEIGKVTNTNTDKGFKIMMYSYVPTMLLWVCVVMFLTLSMS